MIYQKTINFGALPNSSIKTVTFSSSAVSQIISVEGIGTAGQNFFPIPYTKDSSSTDRTISMFTTNTSVSIVTFMDLTSASAYITLKYTKAT